MLKTDKNIVQQSDEKKQPNLVVKEVFRYTKVEDRITNTNDAVFKLILRNIS